MSTIQQTSNATASPGGTGSSIGKPASGTQDRFLKLLVTQMKNQDPLNPMDNAQVTSQMAQLSMVDGIEKVNASIAQLAAGLAGGQAVQATGLVGRDVLAAGSTVALVGGKATFGATLPQSVDSLTVEIHDTSGKGVHTMKLGPQIAGNLLLHWDGKTDAGTAAPDGTYRFTLGAMAAGKSVPLTSLSLGRVESVSPGTNGVAIGISGAGKVALNEVAQIF